MRKILLCNWVYVPIKNDNQQVQEMINKSLKVLLDNHMFSKFQYEQDYVCCLKKVKALAFAEYLL